MSVSETAIITTTNATTTAADESATTTDSGGLTTTSATTTTADESATTTDSGGLTKADAKPFGSNRLINPSFEDDPLGSHDPRGWTYPKGDSYVVTTTYAVDGAQAFGNTWNGIEYESSNAEAYPQASLYQEISAREGEEMVVSASFTLQGNNSLVNYTGDRTAEGLEYIFEDDARIRLQAFDAAGALIGGTKSTWCGEYAGQNNLTAGRWARFDRELAWTTPEGTATVRVTFEYGDGNDSYQDHETGGNTGNAGVYTDNAAAYFKRADSYSAVLNTRITGAIVEQAPSGDDAIATDAGSLTAAGVTPYAEDPRRGTVDTAYLGDGYLGDSYLGSGDVRERVIPAEQRQRPSIYDVEQYPDLIHSLRPRGPDRPRGRINANMKSPPFPVSEAPPSDEDRFSNWDGYITAFSAEMEELEMARDETTLARYVDTAQTGALDNIGDLVNTPRERGEDDDHYRARLKLKLRVSIGGGTLADVKEASAAILDTTPDRVGIDENFREEPARFKMELDRQDIDEAGVPFEDFVDIITNVKAAGVRVFGTFIGAFTHRSQTDFENGVSDPDLSYAQSFTQTASGVVERTGGGKYASLAWTPEERIVL